MATFFNDLNKTSHSAETNYPRYHVIPSEVTGSSLNELSASFDTIAQQNIKECAKYNKIVAGSQDYKKVEQEITKNKELTVLRRHIELNGNGIDFTSIPAQLVLFSFMRDYPESQWAIINELYKANILVLEESDFSELGFARHWEYRLEIKEKNKAELYYKEGNNVVTISIDNGKATYHMSITNVQYDDNVLAVPFENIVGIIAMKLYDEVEKNADYQKEIENF